MTITAIADTLLDGLMRSRFHAEPIVQASELLLQERVPRQVTATPASVWETMAGGEDRETEGPALGKGQPAQLYAGYAIVIERPLFGNAHGRGVRLQHLAGPGGDAVARGRDLR